MARVTVTVETEPDEEVLAALEEVRNEVSEANDKLVELQTQLADTSADVLAKLAQLEGQLGELPADAQATLDSIKASVSSLDSTVGDADGSDTPPVEPPTEPTPL